MCTAVALPTSELPDDVVGQLHARVHTRGDQKEVRFDWRAVPALLPVWWGGTLQVVRWGNRDRHERQLPPTGWTWRASVEAGKWAFAEAEEVEVPATYGYMNGVWYRVRQGVRGLLVRSPSGVPAVFVVCEPATRYYRVMTRAEWMPVLIGEVI